MKLESILSSIRSSNVLMTNKSTPSSLDIKWFFKIKIYLSMWEKKRQEVLTLRPALATHFVKKLEQQQNHNHKPKQIKTLLVCKTMQLKVHGSSELGLLNLVAWYKMPQTDLASSFCLEASPPTNFRKVLGRSVQHLEVHFLLWRLEIIACVLTVCRWRWLRPWRVWQPRSLCLRRRDCCVSVFERICQEWKRVFW